VNQLIHMVYVYALLSTLIVFMLLHRYLANSVTALWQR